MSMRHAVARVVAAWVVGLPVSDERNFTAEAVGTVDESDLRCADAIIKVIKGECPKIDLTVNAPTDFSIPYTHENWELAVFRIKED